MSSHKDNESIMIVEEFFVGRREYAVLAGSVDEALKEMENGRYYFVGTDYDVGSIDLKPYQPTNSEDSSLLKAKQFLQERVLKNKGKVV